MTDADFVIQQLRHGPRSTNDLLRASFDQRSVGLTVHSRIADLRRHGYQITCHTDGETTNGRTRYVYTLISEPAGQVAEPEPSVGPLEQMVLA